MPNKSQSNAQTPCMARDLYILICCSPRKVLTCAITTLTRWGRLRSRSPSAALSLSVLPLFAFFCWSVLFLNGLPLRFGCQFESVARCSRSSRLLPQHSLALSLSLARTLYCSLARSHTRTRWAKPFFGAATTNLVALFSIKNCACS